MSGRHPLRDSIVADDPYLAQCYVNNARFHAFVDTLDGMAPAFLRVAADDAERCARTQDMEAVALRWRMDPEQVRKLIEGG